MLNPTRKNPLRSINLLMIFHLSSSWVASFESPPSIPIDHFTCKPTGLIQDTSCDFETVDEVNRRLRSELASAVRLPIFRYHKVDLYRQCPFWAEDGLCGNRACAVDELDQEDVPAYWRTSELSDLKTTTAKDIPIDLKNKCVVKEQDYCVLDDDNGLPSNGVYVDLLANPERFTGYSGKSAQRVWRAIYQENCFDAPQRSPSSPFSTPLPTSSAGLEPEPGLVEDDTWGNGTCLEKRVYYKLLSGLHTSISMHICDEYLDPNTGRWVPNLQCYLNRIGLYPERLENLYFAYTLMLRALSRSASYLSSSAVELCTGDPKADSATRKSLDRLIAIAHDYPVTFDETSMFKNGSDGQNTLKEEFKEHFRNVSRIMDCVGCDKCRLWGKLQIMGLGTGLKLLFEYEESAIDHSNFHLTRPELIAFINTLNRLSESVASVDKFTKLWQQRFAQGTLPNRVQDEKLDSLTSGRAAKLISLANFESVSPLVDSSASKNKVEVTDHNAQDLQPKNDVSKVSESIAPVPVLATPKKAPNPTGSSQSLRPAYVSSSHRPSGNESEQSIRSTIRTQVVDLSLLFKPAGRLFKWWGEKCKHSFAACSHWIEGLFGHMKTLVLLSRARSHNHHYQDNAFRDRRGSHAEKQEL